VTSARKEVADELRELTPGGTKGEQAVRSLANKLEGKHYADLAGVDLAGAYAPERVLPEPRRRLRTALSLGEMIRDALVFVPVAYTWWKISDALEAFSSYRGGDPFLLAWQRGFVAADADASTRKVEPLAQSAMTVASVIGLVILLTVVTHVGRGWYERQVVARQHRLGALLADATRLSPGRSRRTTPWRPGRSWGGSPARSPARPKSCPMSSARQARTSLRR
jgi:hypothetical protein